jgi:hypothetical protein
MASNINPSTWASWDLRAQDKQFDTKIQVLLSQLSQFAVQTQQQLTTLMSARGLANILNGSGLLNVSSLLVSQNDLGTLTSNPTVNANSAAAVVVAFTSAVTQTLTLTINNLVYGTPVFITVNVTVGTLTLKIAATLPSATTYGISSYLTSTLASTNMATGLAIASAVNSQFFGVALPKAGAPSLFLYNV